MTSSQETAKRDIIQCLAESKCQNADKKISDFMNSFRLWDKLINTEGKLEEEIRKVDNSFPTGTISQLYNLVRSDLIKHFEIETFKISMAYINDNTKLYDKYLTKHINIARKYVNRQDLIDPNFKYNSYNSGGIPIYRITNPSINIKYHGLRDTVRVHGDAVIKLMGQNKIGTKGFNNHILKMTELIQLDERIIDDENSQRDLINDFKLKCPYRNEIIESILPHMKIFIRKQRTSVDEMSLFIDEYENANFVHAWQFLKDFIDAFSVEKTQRFDISELKMIFYNRFSRNELEKFVKLKRLLDDYDVNYERITMKQSLVDYLKLNSGGDNVYLEFMHQIRDYYEIDLKIYDYTDFRKIFLDKDITIVESDTFLLFEYYIKFVNYKERDTALNELYIKILANKNVHFIEVYQNIADVTNKYHLNDKAISYDELYDKVKKFDHVANELVLKSVHSYIVQYISLKDRMDTRALLETEIKKYSHSICFFTSDLFDKFSELYEVHKITNFEYDVLESYFRDIDKNMIHLRELEYISKYVEKCLKYNRQKRIRKRLIEFVETNKDKPILFSADTDRYIEAHELTEYDVKNYHNFLDKVKILDEIVPAIELKEIYHHVITRENFNKRLELLGFITRSDNVLHQNTKQIEELISEYQIDLNQLTGTQDLKNKILKFDGIAIDKQIQTVYGILIKYRNYLNRKNDLTNLISYLRKDHKMTDYETSLYMNPVISGYKLDEKEINSRTVFENLILEIDEIIDSNDMDLLYREILKYMDLYKRKSYLRSVEQHIKENEKFKFVYLSKNFKLYVDAYKLTLNDVSSINKYIQKVKSMDEKFEEQKLKVLYKRVLNYMAHRKVTEGLKLMETTLRSEHPTNLIKLESAFEYIINYYDIKEEALVDFRTFYKAVNEKDVITSETMFDIAYQKINFYFKSKIIKNNKRQVNINQYDLNTICEVEKNLEEIINTYSLVGKILSNVFEFHQIAARFENVAIEEDSVDIYHKVSERLKIYDNHK